MGKILTVVLSWFSTALISTILKWLFSGTVGLISYSIVQALFWKYINNGLNELSSSADFSFVLNLSRLDEAISIIIGALGMRASLLAMTVQLVSNEN